MKDEELIRPSLIRECVHWIATRRVSRKLATHSLAIDYRFFSFVGTLFTMAAGILYGYQPLEQVHVS